MLLIESALAMLALLLAFVRPTLGSRWFDKAEHIFSRVAERRGLTVTAIGIATLALRVVVLPIEPIPEPSVHDEFAYLLQADTFAHGRLTNPTHPMWVHFETFHVIQQPTYCAKFFPGQALFLAFGKVVFGHPFWGVWLSSGLMCAAITWMLQGWFSAEWAFLGGALAMLRYGVFGYWADSYWGGNVAAIGGALVLGALPRIKLSRRVGDAVLMGSGLALLANSRPWEGMVLSLPVAIMLFAWMLSANRPPFRVSLRRIVLPLALIVGATAGWLAYYDWRTTRKPLRTPYQVYEQTYGAIPYMIWQHIRPEPSYQHTILHKFNIEHESFHYRSFYSPVAHMLRIFAITTFFLGPILILPIVTLLFALPYGFSFRRIDPLTRTLLLCTLVFAAGTELALFYNPHYSAPATCLIMALLLLAMRRIRGWNRGGLFLARTVPVICIVAFSLRATADPLHFSKSRYSTYYWNEFFELHPKGWFPRAAIQSDLYKIPGNHLVIVHYSPEHEPFPDWVYNDADIDHARIVWARDMEPVENKELLTYFRDRRAWLLRPDENPPILTPFPSQINQGGAQAGNLK
jgi:hypothetical protein